MKANHFTRSEQRTISFAALFIVPMLLFLSACHSGKTEEANAVKPAPATDSGVVYYPVNDYIRRQIKDVDSTPYYLYRISITGKKRDSSAVSRPGFDLSVKGFLLPQLESEPFGNNFTEAVFQDESTNSITLTYTPKEKSSIVQNISVLLNKENQNVKWIFINMLSNAGDSTVIQRITWKGDQSCSLNTSITYKDKPEAERQLRFVWNEKKEEE